MRRDNPPQIGKNYGFPVSLYDFIGRHLEEKTRPDPFESGSLFVEFFVLFVNSREKRIRRRTIRVQQTNGLEEEVRELWRKGGSEENREGRGREGG